MGNVQKYSKGCGTCIRRRVKCVSAKHDLISYMRSEPQILALGLYYLAKSANLHDIQDGGRPTCKRCVKGGFDCEGFKLPTFVDATEQIMKRFSRQSESQSVSTSIAVSSSQAPSHAADTETPQSVSSMGLHQELQHSRQIPRSPSFSPLQTDIYVSYTVEYLCKGPAAVIYSHASSLLNHTTEGKAMPECLLALATTFYGRQNREIRIVQEGMRRYGRGLSLVRKRISMGIVHICTELLVAVYAFTMIEVRPQCSLRSTVSHGRQRIRTLRLSVSNGCWSLDRKH